MLCARTLLAALSALILVLSAASTANADLIAHLSEYSSDEEVLPLWLDATLTFAVNGNDLEILVENDTAEPHPYFLTELHFNVSDRITNLVLLNAPGWSAEFDPDALHVANFGLFDVSVKNGVGDINSTVPAGSSVVLNFTISGTGPFTIADFAEFSSPVGKTHVAALAAAKFVSSEGEGEGAYGASIPEPAFMALLAAGLPVLLRRRS